MIFVVLTGMRIFTLNLISIVLITIPASAASPPVYCSFEIAGYYPGYSQWLNPPENMRFGKYTRINYFSIYPNADGTLNLSQISPELQASAIDTARSNSTQIYITIGGWGLSDGFSPMAANNASRTGFIGALLQYCLEHGFDGADLDWEPVVNEYDKDNYTLLIKELKAAFAPHSLGLSVAVMAQGSEFRASAIEDIDRLNVMAYDLGYPLSSYSESVAALTHWQDFGFPASKIILGIPMYGRDTQGTYYPYSDIVRTYNPIPSSDLVDGISFNGIDTVSAKTRYCLENGFAGVMFWEISLDTTDETSILAAASATAVAYFAPDYNCDGMVALADLEYFTSNWLWVPCNPVNAWCGGTDLDRSGEVTARDFLVLSQHWLCSK
jgi:chitinase